ncbi:uncharacterized protein BKA55DRAFT_536813 [Fusarium redolens]|uniref:Uncharacterized protein n=1 Tax=Fusarium redolens TaxID=48865 RepID=A0A9P9HKK6_FUSRE|nr:uncharacterized protein BKA55DRAFT_536813 [Fusarium redolens]KAH7259111.1 hypothetical protein BKA55DRAFT_536813 [Fusarium redolens]
MSASGACTVLAIRASAALQEEDPDNYEFKMYDVGGHRICRCLKTFAIIDSSSHEGAIVKPPGEEWKSKNVICVWQSDGSASMRTQHEVIIPGDLLTYEELYPISFEEGLATRLYELADSAKIVTLFRFTNKYGKRYSKGYIRWFIDEDNYNDPPASRPPPPRKFLVLYKGKGDKTPQRIVWREGIRGYQDKAGTPNTSIASWLAVEKFVKQWGDETLWTTDDCNLVHEQIWVALVEHYGFPVLKEG